MGKIYLFLALCLMSVMPVRAEKDYVAIISPYPDETVLTLYYVDNPEAFCAGVNEWHWIGEDFTWFFNGPGPLSEGGDPFRVKKIIIDKSVKDARPTSMGWFTYFDDLRTIVGMENINTSQVTSMAAAFIYTYLDVIDISTWDFSNVTDVSSMFYDCHARTIYCNVDMSAMPKITASEGMFGGDARYVRLQGENGTAWDANHIDKSYARPDKPGQPGYFSKKPTTAQGQMSSSAAEASMSMPSSCAHPTMSSSSGITAARRKLDAAGLKDPGFPETASMTKGMPVLPL